MCRYICMDVTLGCLMDGIQCILKNVLFSAFSYNYWCCTLQCVWKLTRNCRLLNGNFENNFMQLEALKPSVCKLILPEIYTVILIIIIILECSPAGEYFRKCG